MMRIVLRFHGPSPWTKEDEEEWLRVTGHREASTKVLCDYIREVQRQEALIDNTPHPIETALDKVVDDACAFIDWRTKGRHAVLSTVERNLADSVQNLRKERGEL